MKKINKYQPLAGILLSFSVFLSCGLTSGPASRSRSEGSVPADAPYKKASLPIDTRIADLLSRMTLEEKIGQMTQIERGSLRAGDISRYKLGSVLSGGGGAPAQNTAAAWKAMISAYQDEARATRLQIPLLYGIDAVHGHNNLQNATIFPHNIALGAAGEAELVRRIGIATAEEMAATGIYWNFAPCIAVAQDPRWGRFYESYGQDSSAVARLGRAYIEGFQSAGTMPSLHPIATAKHFLGDGGTRWGSSTTDNYKIDQGNTPADEQYLQEVLFPPYEEALKAGVRTIMVSFSSLNGVKMHANKELITGVLKTKWGFSGFVVSDWGGIDQVSPDYGKALTLAINAGIDMVMVPYDANRFINTMTQLVKENQIPMSRIEDAVRRILRVKFEMGLFDADPVKSAPAETVVRSPEHLALAREAAAKGVVVLKNEGVLPLAPAQWQGKKLYVSGYAADDMGIQCGGWTISWQGSAGSITKGTTILAGLKDTLAAANIMYTASAEFDTADPQGLCVVVAGELPYAEGKGDSAELKLPQRELDAIAKARKQFKKVVLVIVSGRPVILDKTALSCDAIVAAWLPGSEGAGVTDVLTGLVPSSGKLPCDWPASANRPSDEKPLFPRGFGL